MTADPGQGRFFFTGAPVKNSCNDYRQAHNSFINKEDFP